MTDEQLQKLAESKALDFDKLKQIHDEIPAEFQTEEDLLFAANNEGGHETLKVIKQATDLQNDYDAYSAK